MDNKEAITVLEQLIKQRKALKDAIKKKRSWRPSEAAMALASYERQIKALQMAIDALACSTVA